MTVGNTGPGELFIIGFNGTQLDDSLKKYLNNIPSGGIILFSRNLVSFDQWRELASGLQELRLKAGNLPYIIAVDEEGGTVSRMPNDNFIFPGARALSQTGNTNTARTCANAIGQILSYTGSNLNLAPVLDVNINPMNPGIGIRSFGTTAEETAKYSTEFIEGLRSAGIFSCAKHFPGKGDIVKDSHKTLPICSATKQELENIHLKPFIEAIRHQIPFIMTSHAVYPALSNDNLPATLSHEILTGLLRNKLGYNGLIISDDLEMGAMTECGEIHEIVYKSIMAGCDMVLICHDAKKQETAYKFVLEKYSDDLPFRNRCDESIRRVTEFKQNLKMQNSLFPEKVKETIRLAAEKSIKCPKNESLRIPLDENVKSGKILLAGTKFRSEIEVEMIGRTPYEITDFHNYLKKYIKNIDMVSWDINPAEFCADKIRKINFDEYSLIILCTNNAILYPNQKNIAETILDNYGEKTILMATKNPEDIYISARAKNIVLTFGYNKANIEAAGDFIIRGNLS